MIDRNIHKFTVSPPEFLAEIRNAQTQNGFILPSDYVYFLLNFNKIEFEGNPILKLGEDTYELVEFNDLKSIVWEINDLRKLQNDLNQKFWLEEYLCISSLNSGKRVLVGSKIENLNKIYLYDNDECFIDFFCENVFEFINTHLVYE